MRKLPPILIWMMPVVSGLLFVAIWYGVRMAQWIAELDFTDAAGNRRRGSQGTGPVVRGCHPYGDGSLGGISAGSGFRFFHLIIARYFRDIARESLSVAPGAADDAGDRPYSSSSCCGRGRECPVSSRLPGWISYFPIVANMTQGLLSTDMNHVALFRMCNASRWQEMRLLRVPSAMPYFLAGLRIAATLAPIGAIFGEYMVGNSSGGSGGLGFPCLQLQYADQDPGAFRHGVDELPARFHFRGCRFLAELGATAQMARFF